METDRRESFYSDCLRKLTHFYPEFDSLSAECQLNLILTYDRLHSHFAKRMAQFGLAKSNFNILMILRHSGPEGLQLHELGELLIVSRANVTGLVDHLEQKGYVTRVVDETDRRVRYARITQKGEELIDQVAPRHHREVRRVMDELSEEEKRELIRLLRKVRLSGPLTESEGEGSQEVEHSSIVKS